MLVHVQFPIADLRGFSGGPRLLRPNWYAEPIPDKDFVRGIGVVRRRPSGGLSNWSGEDPCCNAHCVVRMDMNEQRKRGFLPFHVDVRFRRFYSDGLALAKFEIGFSTSRIFLADEFLQYLQALAVLPIRVRVEPPLSWLTHMRLRLRSWLGMRRRTQFARVPLISVGTALAKCYAITTTEHRVQVAARSVDAGSPAIFIETQKSELPPDCLPPAARPVPLSAAGLALYHWWETFFGRRTHIWLCVHERGPKDREVHDLRVYLLRLNAENQVFVRVLNAIAGGEIAPSRGTTEGDLLQEYLNTATSRFLRLEAKTRPFARNGDLLVRVAADIVASAQQRAQLLKKLQQVVTRKNVLRKTQDAATAISVDPTPPVTEWIGVVQLFYDKSIAIKWHFRGIGRMSTRGASTWAAFFFGVMYITILLIVNLEIPNPSPTQYQTFRIILALASAGFGGMIPGILQIDIKSGSKFILHAAGALALFVIIYFFSPGVPPPP